MMKNHAAQNANGQNAISIRALYRELLALENYRPSEKVNRLFTQLVQYVLNPESKNILKKGEVEKLQRTCQKAEYELEKYWAQKIIHGADARALIREFPYFENYVKLAQLEWSSLLSCTTHRMHNICFVGGGPLPLTAIILAETHGQAVTVLDKDRRACGISRKLIQRLDLDEKISVVEADACAYEDYGKFNVIMVAALAGMEKREKEKILLNIKRYAGQETHILARSSWGARELLYRPLDSKFSKLFHPVMEVIPQNDVINSIVIFKNAPLSS
jgi:nicotianamine synthase